MRLEEQVSIITGAASGIGEAGARLFAREGALVVVADIDLSGARRVAEHIKRNGGAAIATQYDASVEADNTKVVQLAEREFGGLNIFWANAGYMPPYAMIDEMSAETLDRSLAVNTRGPWLGARAAVRSMRGRTGNCAILFTASLSGLKARVEMSTYQASKGATVMLTKSLAKELAHLGIRVNSVCPGPIETKMMRDALDDLDAKRARDVVHAIPLGRLGLPSEVASAALYLCSEEASFITGVNLNVDGGLLA